MKTKALSGRNPIWILALCLCIPVFAAGLQAQSGTGSLLLFPRYVSCADESTGIAIFNPNPQAAAVTLTLRGPDGTIVQAENNPIMITVPARGQIAKTPGELFTVYADLDCSLEIASPSPGLVACYQAYDSGLTILDGSEAPAASINMVFPVVPDITEGLAEINLANPSLREASVELKLWNFEGNLLGTCVVQLPANGAFRAAAQNVFPAGTSFSGASHITAVSKPRNVLSAALPVAGTSLFTGFLSHAGNKDWAGFNAIPVTLATNSGVIPYFHTGGIHACTLALVNMDSATSNVTLTAIGNNGSTLAARTISIKPGGGWRAPLQDILTDLRNRDVEGWLLLQATGPVLGGMLYGRSDAASLTALPIQKTPKAEFVFPQVVQAGGLSSMITLVNPSSTAANVELKVVEAGGATVAATQMSIGPGKRESYSLHTWVPEIGQFPGGVLHVRSSGGLFANASIWGSAGAIVSNIDAQHTAFTAGPLASFAMTGKVLLNGSPLSGARLNLDGALKRSVCASQDGIYAFDNLPAGKYTMEVEQPGFQFAPALASFEITNASQRQDFLGFTAGDSILVQPASIPAYSQNTTVGIFGQGFNATSEVFAGPTRLESSCVDGNQVQAVIPAHILTTPGNLEFVVSTTGSDSVVWRSRPYHVLVYMDRPFLAAVHTSGTVVEGSPGAYLNLQGTGFLPGALVSVNGKTDAIKVNVFSDVEILAFVPSSYFEQGGILPVTVDNPYPAGSRSNVQLLTVYYAAPVVQSVLPKSTPVRLEAGTPALDIEILGYGFRRGAVVWLEDTPLYTAYCETDAYCLSIHLYAKVPADLLATAGFAKIMVRNPDPSLDCEQVGYLEIDGLKPTITAVLPGAATLTDNAPKFSMPIVISGTNFGPETEAAVYRDGNQPKWGEVELISSTQLVLWIQDVTYPGSLGDWFVRVHNPTPGGGESDAVDFYLSSANLVQNPFLISLSPATAAPAGPAFTLTLNGINLRSGTVVYFNNSPLVTTVISTKEVKAEVPASLIRMPGKFPIFVTNPDIGGSSNRLYLDIR